MKITNVDIPKEDGDGLEAIKMERLGDVVLISGKNGSGKTRILKKIFETYTNKPTGSILKRSAAETLTLQSTLSYYQQQLNTNEKQLEKQTELSKKEEIKKQIDHLKNLEKDVNDQIKNYQDLKQWHLIDTDVESDNYSFVPFVPKQLKLSDPNEFRKHEIVRHASNVDVVGVGYLPQGVFSKIQFIQDRWHNATHQSSKFSEEDKQKAIQNYEKLGEIIEIFLNTKITRTIDGEATLFGFPLGKSNLSDGQKILLQFSLAIYSQEKSLTDLILVLDEPENHLHPSVIIETIKRIQKSVTNGQIWIATHSIPLLAHFDPSLLWFVDQGKISYGGKIPEKVLQSLLGNEDDVGKLQDFISLPSQYAASRYACESLLEPSVVMTDSSDPQSMQIRKDLSKIAGDKKLRILDYGAGKGRLISNIADLDSENQIKLLEAMEYVAFDEYSNEKECCKASLIKVFQTAEKKYYNDFISLFSDFDKGSFDVVIMCNVLHEIDPKDWLDLFQSDGKISECLKENGVLLLVEDQQIPIGEKAYQNGFLVLDTPQIKDLFQITEQDKEFKYVDFRCDGRLKSHYIPKNLLNRINENSRTKAIKSISDVAKGKIKEIRRLDKNYKNGKLHGFWTQQFANAQLSLAELTTNLL